VVLGEIRRRVAEDPFLKFGIVAMTFALASACVVAFVVFLQEPQQAVAAKSPRESTHGTLVRSDPDMDPRVERDIPSPGTSQERGSQSDVSGSDASRSGSAPHQSRQEALPLQEDDYPLPTDEQLRATNHPRHYHLPPGAIMSLTINAIGLKNAPVLNSESTRALDQGVVHLPGTSYPWSDTPERNVYLAGHRLGWPGTGSHLVFYRLNQLE